MTRINREHLQKRIAQHYINIANKQKHIIVKHFLQEKFRRQIIYSIVKKYEDSSYVGGKPRSGRSKKLSRGKLTRLKRLQWASGVIKKQRAPKYTDQQLEEIPARARRLYRILSNNDFDLIMDDEKYVLLQDQSVPTNRGFYTSDKRTTPSQIKFKRIQKFEPKILVWIAISENGISKLFFFKTKASC
ncbi:unnamed protein product [Rotaria socialis]|uniref:Transposase n=2 Tax=Rotaria socialis TaxID=392032 RepID=A0A820YTP2_9BILA|nr:unnamed protein product [Rotaria socialis]CAF4554966.1 unnamed protein product [Rotaria socialis]